MDEPLEGTVDSPFGVPIQRSIAIAGRWSKLLGPPALVTLVASLITLGATVLLFRQLPSEQAGKLAVLLAFVEILSLIATLGHSTVIIRLYSRPNPEGFAWQKDLRTITRNALPIVLIGTIVAALAYDVDLLAVTYIGSTSAVLAPTFALIWMLNAQGHYIWSALLNRLPFSLLAVPALLFVLVPSAVELNVVLGMHVFSVIGVSLLCLMLVRSRIKPGPIRISSAERGQGPYFLANQLSLLLSFQGLFVIAGAIILPARLAVFAAVAVLFRVFRLIASILAMVFPPEIIRASQPPYKRLFVGTVAIAVAGAILTLTLGPTFIQTIYGGKYDDGEFLIFWMALSGVLLVMEVLPRSHIPGKLEWSKLRPFILIQLPVMFAVFVIGLILVVRFELLGIAIATALSLIVRNILAYGYFAITLSKRSAKKSRTYPLSTELPVVNLDAICA